MALVTFIVEKTREVNVGVARELLEVAAAKREPLGYKAALVAYGQTALPLVDPTTDWTILPRAYEELPLLGKSPNLVKALTEALELITETENPLEPKQAIIVWSAAVRPGREADIVLKTLESLGVKTAIVVTRPSPPGWIKYNPVIAERIVTVRSNTNIAKLYEKLIQQE